MYDLCIFDLDGTLIDSVGDIADALNKTLGASFTDEQVAGWVGSGVRALVERAGVAAAELDGAVETFRAHYAAQPAKHTRLYLGVKETLRALGQHDIIRAVATNKPGALARAIASRLALNAQLDILPIGEDDVGARKPDPLMVDIIRGKAGVTRERTLYVGDSLVDPATAQAAAIDCCLVTYGYADPEAIRAAPADYCIDRFDELIPILAPK